MKAMDLPTNRLKLVPRTIEEVRARIAAMAPADRAQLSADWLAQFNAATSADMWVLGFTVVQREGGLAVGQCGFKGPPAEGMVEIAYGIDPEHQRQGYATEAAAALTAYAFGSGGVRVVRAHTLPEPNASTRVLTKCGFRRVGDFLDPEDGLVWRWEKENGAD